MKTHYRGTQINFEGQFTSTAGVIVQVTAASLTIQHPLDGFPLWNGTHSTTYSMTNASTVSGTWEYNWDSTPSAGGYVSWHMIPASSVAVAKSGTILIKSGPAATWSMGPSTVTANDEMVP